MRNRGSHKPSGSIADIAGAKRAKPITKRCTCGALIQSRKTFCGPCYDVRYQENVAAGRLRRAAIKRVGLPA